MSNPTAEQLKDMPATEVVKAGAAIIQRSTDALFEILEIANQKATHGAGDYAWTRIVALARQGLGLTP